MTQLLQVPINKLKLDPNQPRQFIDDKHVRELSISIKNEGVINAIETDSDYAIITGELRFRAAKLAGLKEVPVKILTNEKTKGMPRFIRQLQENMHHNTMSVMDTALALKRVADNLVNSLPKKQGHSTNHCRELSRIFGTTHAHISELLNLLKEPEDIQEILKTKNRISYSVFSVIRSAPKQYQDTLKRKAINEKLPRDGMRFLSKKLKELDELENYKFANDILKRDYSNMETSEIISEASRISSGVQYTNDDKQIIERLDQITNEAIKLLEQRPLSLLNGLNQTRVRISITLFIGILVEYLENEQKRIEIKKILQLK